MIPALNKHDYLPAEFFHQRCGSDWRLIPHGFMDTLAWSDDELVANPENHAYLSEEKRGT